MLLISLIFSTLLVVLVKANLQLGGFDLSARLVNLSECSQTCIASYAGIINPIEQEMIWAVCINLTAVSDNLESCGTGYGCPPSEAYLINLLPLVCEMYKAVNPIPANWTSPIIPKVPPFVLTRTSIATIPGAITPPPVLTVTYDTATTTTDTATTTITELASPLLIPAVQIAVGGPVGPVPPLPVNQS
ncbi:hypothetical protein HDU97_009236 [Phlyctochytrium planicorne]|nr:hypothetical protein HDU97_009236 [Phlyctochytrium planicorne]